MAPVLSVVIPVLDEHESLPTLLARLIPVLESSVPDTFEVIFVDDGSGDETSSMLDFFQGRDGRLRVIHFSRNFGHQAALHAGLEAAEGRAVVLMDADLQDRPEAIPAMLEQWRAGREVVYIVRTHRKEGVLKRAAYWLFYRSLNAIAHIDVPRDSGDFCLLDRRVVDALVALPEHHRFLRGLRSWVGFRQIGIEYEREARLRGVSKYGLRKLLGLAASGYLGFSAVPLRLAAWLGLVAGGSGFGLMLYVMVGKFVDPLTPRGWASTMAAILFMGGVQLLVLGVLGEFLSRVYDEVRRRPLFVVRARVGFDAPARGAGDEREAELPDLAERPRERA